MKNFFIKTLNGMAYGLFATLIVGVILKQIGDGLQFAFLSNTLYPILEGLMGVGIAVGIGLVLKRDGLNLIMLAAIGAISSKMALAFDANNVLIVKDITVGPGNPLTVYFVAIISILLLDKILVKKTPVDIIIIPLVSITVGVLLTLLFSLPLDFLSKLIQNGLKLATEGTAGTIPIIPVIMVMIISVVMGMLLTAPISSLAIGLIVFSGNGVAQGAAVVGTSIQMIGFAIQSIRDNKIGTVISIGIGTSMLQFKNIVKKPIIWLPTIISSAIIAPIVYFIGFESTSYGAGMGTSGLVGPLQSFDAMKDGKMTEFWISLIIIIFFGGLLVYIFDRILYMKGYIANGDLSLDEQLN